MNVISVFGPFASRALVEMSVDQARKLVDGELPTARRTNVIDAVQRDVDKLPEELAESGLAATAISLAYELEDPFNSATSKSMCAKALGEALAQLRALAPAKQEADKLDDLTARREARRSTAAAGSASS